VALEVNKRTFYCLNTRLNAKYQTMTNVFSSEMAEKLIGGLIGFLIPWQKNLR